MLSRFVNWIGNNAIQVDAVEAEAKLRETVPGLLLDDEQLEMSFKMERDHFYFTSIRVLFRDKKNVTGKKVNYLSLPYNSIKAFSVETGGNLDTDTELRLWSPGVGRTKFDFVKGRADIFEIHAFFNRKVLFGNCWNNLVDVQAVSTPQVETTTGSMDEFLNWLGGDATEVDAAYVENQLKTAPKVLDDEERVDLAFRCGRDMTLFTSERFLIVDVKGWSGKKVEYRSVLWSSLRAFSVTTAGGFLDRDAEMKLFTDLESMKEITQDFRKGKADVLGVQRYISDKLLGLDTGAPCGEEFRGFATSEQNLFAFVGDDARQIDAREVNGQLHSARVVQNCETVEMAFKGRRDLTVFTTKRLLIVDVKGWSGKKVKYISIPWRHVQAFAVRSAGTWDKDSEMMIWTQIMHDYDAGDPPSPVPGMSYFEQDFQKSVDIMSVHRYLTLKCLGEGQDCEVSATQVLATPDGSTEKLLSWLGQDARQVEPAEVDHHFRSVLAQSERVLMAFRVGRDTLCFTSHRALFVDVQGLSGQKIEYRSIPWRSVGAFSVESAGSWDRDGQVHLFVRAPWMPRVSHDLRKGQADIMAIQTFLGMQIFGSDDGSLTVPVVPAVVKDPGAFDAFLSWVGDDAREVDAVELNARVHSSPPLLQNDEIAVMAFKVHRDTFVVTTKRLLLIDVKGWSGKKIEYLSIPLKSCTAFDVESAGSFDRDAEVGIYGDVPALHHLCQDLRKGSADIFQIQRVLATKIVTT